MGGYLPKNFLSPFDSKTMTPKDVGFGGPSTEYLATEYDSNGKPVNVPLIWWDHEGNPHKMTPKNALAMLDVYESGNNVFAPRYDSIGQAVEFAQHRSANGGATNSPLFGKR